MRTTLFSIPLEIAGVPLFGFGILLAMWLLGGIALTLWAAKRHGWTSETLGYLPVIAVGAAIIVFILPALVDESGLPIRAWGVMVFLAFAGAVALSARRAKQAGLDPELIVSLSFWLFVSGIIGARLFYVIEYWERSFHKPTIRETLLAIVNVPQGGMVVYGSLIAGGIALAAFIYKYRLPGLVVADVIAPGVVLGMALGRVGCFLNGCCYGGACDLPWAVTFPVGSPPYQDQAEQGRIPILGIELAGRPNDPPIIARVAPDSEAARQGLKADDRIATIEATAPGPNSSVVNRPVSVKTVAEARSLLLARARAGSQISLTTADAPGLVKTWTVTPPLPRSLKIHPAQLYSAIDASLLCLFLVAYTPFRRREGELLGLLLIIHPISRFLLEIIRIDETSVFGTGLSISQNISGLILLGGVVFWIYLLSRPAGLHRGPQVTTSLAASA